MWGGGGNLAGAGGDLRRLVLDRERAVARRKGNEVTVVKEICPRGNNKVAIYISLYHDKFLLFMLELY